LSVIQENHTDEKKLLKAIDGSSVWGIDIGGANIKLCRSDGHSLAVPFPMWTDHARLGSVVHDLLRQLENSRSECNLTRKNWSAESVMAVTMTGELADCFFSRREGVACILNGLTCAIPAEQCRIYAVGGDWLSIEQAKLAPWDVAASNWYALASWLVGFEQLRLREYHTIVDIGSTTVDIIPIKANHIGTDAKTDRQRMQLGQLVYTGMERTPIHAVVQQLIVDGEPCPVMAERFSTVVDAHLILGTADEQPDNLDTADGRPRTRRAAMARLARMVGEDSETLSQETIENLAEQVLDAQCQQVTVALTRNLPARSNHDDSRAPNVIVTGHGRPLIDRLRQTSEFADVHFTMLDDLIGPTASRCAPALAVAQLWQQQAERSGCHG
jgi:(4-(4-[2-(gamma-L-glutamylamino)ethyl]phenoxymethyl)furan-2-yl)methanamine synthase